MIDATGGEITFDNMNVMNLKKKELKMVRTRIGMIFQHYNLVNRLSVIENTLHGILGKNQRLLVFLVFIIKQRGSRQFEFYPCLVWESIFISGQIS